MVMGWQLLGRAIMGAISKGLAERALLAEAWSLRDASFQGALRVVHRAVLSQSWLEQKR